MAVYIPALTIIFLMSANQYDEISPYLLVPAAFASSLSYIASARYPAPARKSRTRARIRTILRTSKPLLVGTLGAFGASHLYIYAAAYFLGEEAVGGISAIRNLIGPAIVLIIAIENITIRGATLAFQKGPDVHRSYILRSTAIWTIVFILMALILSIAPHGITSLVYGDEFTEYSVYLSALAFLPVLQLWNRIYAMGLVAQESYSVVGLANMRSLLFSVVTVVPVIMFFEIWGVIIGLFIQQLVVLLYQTGLIGKRIDSARSGNSKDLMSVR